MSAQNLGSRAILGRMYQRLTAGPMGWVDRLSFFVNSDQASEEHRWLGMSPAMRVWVNGRQVHGLHDSGIVIPNLSFEASIGVGLDEIRRDKTAQVMRRVDDLVGRYNQHGAKLLSELTIAGEAGLCYDGQFYFDTDHAEGSSGTQSNDLTTAIVSATAPTAEEMRTVILTAIQAMLGFKDDQGEPINETARDFLVMVPTPLWGAAVSAVTLPQLSQGASNILKALEGEFNISVLPNPRLTWTDKFAVFRADQGDGAAPFIRQQETPLNVSSQAEGSPEEFYNKRHVYGIDYNGNFGFGFWQHAVLTTLTTA
jgi:phage major head subunit gpT-like protein